MSVLAQRKTVALLALLLVITFISLSPIISAEFINWDNYPNLLENINVRHFDFYHISKIFTHIPLQTYCPLAILSYAVEYSIAGYAPFLYHLDNLILHLLCTSMVFLFAKRCGLNSTGAFVSSLIFGIHPIHVEPVAWIAGRKDLLCAFFYISALCTYLHYIKYQDRRRLFLVWTLGLLGFLAKPMAASLPLSLLACDWLVRRQYKPGVFLEKIFFLIYIIPLGAITYQLHTNQHAVLGGKSFLIWIWTGTFYIKQFLSPLTLNPLYTLPQPVHVLHLPYISGLMVFAACAFAVFRLRKNRLFVFAFLYYICTIIFLLRVHETLSFTTTFVADRYMYLPSLGFCLVIGYGITSLLRKSLKWSKLLRVGLMLAACFLVFLSGDKTHRQSKIWKNNFVFWGAVIRMNPGVANAYINRGAAYFNDKQYDMALKDFEKAIEIYPEYSKAFNNKGSVYAIQGRYALAIEDFSRAIKIDPQGASLAYFHRSLAYRDTDQYEKALFDAVRARGLGVRINPEYIEDLRQKISSKVPAGK